MLQKAQEAVRKFMLAAGQHCPSEPTVPLPSVRKLRVKLNHEESVKELEEGFEEQDLVKIADAIGDSLVVVLGAAIACGIDISPIFEEICRSNMTKFIDGYMRNDGKWMKGPSYEPACIQPLIERQIDGA